MPRYLKGNDDAGKAFEPSPDPLLAELSAIVAPLEVKEGPQDFRLPETAVHPQGRLWPGPVRSRPG